MQTSVEEFIGAVKKTADTYNIEMVVNRGDPITTDRKNTVILYMHNFSGGPRTFFCALGLKHQLQLIDYKGGIETYESPDGLLQLNFNHWDLKYDKVNKSKDSEEEFTEYKNEMEEFFTRTNLRVQVA